MKAENTEKLRNQKDEYEFTIEDQKAELQTLNDSNQDFAAQNTTIVDKSKTLQKNLAVTTRTLERTSDELERTKEDLEKNKKLAQEMQLQAEGATDAMTEM